MPPEPAAIGSTHFPLWREVSDFYSRSRLAGYYYLLAWLLLWFTSPQPAHNLWAWAAGCALLATFFVLRGINRPPKVFDPAQLQRWLIAQWLIVLVHSLTWGLMLAGILLHADIAASPLLVILSVVVFSTALAFTYPMRLLPCALAMLFMYLPSILAKYYQGGSEVGESVALMIYLAYLGLFLRRWNLDYHAGVERELRLIRHSEQLEELSRTDVLTALGNRLQFNSLLPAWLATARRQQTPLSLILLDIDFFKRVNDQFGHSTGDLCLQAFAERMRHIFRRDSDILMRLGGEEFAVLMPDTPLEQAAQLAERFRADLVAQPLQLHSQSLALSCSLGVGSYMPLCDDSAEALYRRIDDALYRAKTEGRNRVVLA
ncbi:GGDEF domain-containing protein [Pseudomonas zhanjiangensis]|uniref:diguanylate cyclase n=1 Tax=Pseudomonas zhanjiangensis TaxID=3239015 RepID=A0ABV3YU19_9PSED